jgi:hypothetical protein
VLRVASVLRRLRAQQAQARAKVAAERAKAAALAPGPASAPAPSPTLPSPPPGLTPAAAQLLVDDLQDALWVRASFLAGREAGFARDASDPLAAERGSRGAGRADGASAVTAAAAGIGGGGGAGAAAGAQQQSLRVIDAHRSNLLESATHFVALCNSVAPSPAPAAALLGAGAGGAGAEASAAALSASLASSVELASRLMLSGYVAALSQSALHLLTEAAAPLADGAAAAAVAQQAAYAVRRSGRLGAVDGALLGVAVLAPRLAEACVAALELARRQFAASFGELCAACASYSDVGLRSHVASSFASLANGTAAAANALRAFWTAELSRALGAALAHHADRVVELAQHALADAPSAAAAPLSGLLDASAKEMELFLSTCASVAQLL